jgi:transcriptional regulator with XRE-family HTH domain
MRNSLTVSSWGRALAASRSRLGLSAAAVAQRLQDLGLHVDRTTLYAYEAGRIVAPDAGVLWGLATLYRLPVDQLIASLVAARTGRKPHMSSSAAPTPYELNGEERALIGSFRALSSKDRAACRAFAAFRQFEQQRAKRLRGNTPHRRA